MNLPLYDALIKAGAPVDAARAAAIAVPRKDEVATKRDIAELRAEIRMETANARSIFAREARKQIRWLVAILVGGMTLIVVTETL